MRFACFVLLLSAVAIAAELESEFVPNPRFRPTLGLHSLPSNYKITGRALGETQEIQDIVNYLDDNDMQEILEMLPEALQADISSDDEAQAMPRSVGSVIVDHIPWGKIVQSIQKMAKQDSKFNKVLNLVNDKKFQELVKKAVNSQTLRQFIKNVSTHGFSWTEFLHLLLHSLCSAATTIQHDKYSVGVCQVLQNL